MSSAVSKTPSTHNEFEGPSLDAFQTRLPDIPDPFLDPAPKAMDAETLTHSAPQDTYEPTSAEVEKHYNQSAREALNSSLHSKNPNVPKTAMIPAHPPPPTQSEDKRRCRAILFWQTIRSTLRRSNSKASIQQPSTPQVNTSFPRMATPSGPPQPTEDGDKTLASGLFAIQLVPSTNGIPDVWRSEIVHVIPDARADRLRPARGPGGRKVPVRPYAPGQPGPKGSRSVSNSEAEDGKEKTEDYEENTNEQRLERENAQTTRDEQKKKRGKRAVTSGGETDLASDEKADEKTSGNDEDTDEQEPPSNKPFFKGKCRPGQSTKAKRRGEDESDENEKAEHGKGEREEDDDDDYNDCADDDDDFPIPISIPLPQILAKLKPRGFRSKKEKKRRERQQKKKRDRGEDEGVRREAVGELLEGLKDDFTYYASAFGRSVRDAILP